MNLLALSEPSARRRLWSRSAPTAHLIHIDAAAEAQRAAGVEQDAGPAPPGVVKYTTVRPIKKWVAHMTGQLSNPSPAPNVIAETI